MLQIVVIDLDTQEDPNLIFETLNARGTPLEESDLVKNYVLSGGQALELWGNLDDRWWREEVRQGRIRRPRLDMLLNHWLAMRTSTEVGERVQCVPHLCKCSRDRQGERMSNATWRITVSTTPPEETTLVRSCSTTA